MRFASTAGRSAFARELTESVAGLVSKYHDEAAAGGRQYRVLVAVHPSITAPGTVPGGATTDTAQVPGGTTTDTAQVPGGATTDTKPESTPTDTKPEGTPTDTKPEGTPTDTQES